MKRKKKSVVSVIAWTEGTKQYSYHITFTEKRKAFFVDVKIFFVKRHDIGIRTGKFTEQQTEINFPVFLLPALSFIPYTQSK